jgi:hypothetical protein
MLIQNRNPKFRPLCLFVLTFHEYEARFVFGFRLDYKLSPKAEEHVVKIEKENCMDRSVIEPIIIDFCDDECKLAILSVYWGLFLFYFFHIILFWYQ